MRPSNRLTSDYCKPTVIFFGVMVMMRCRSASAVETIGNDDYELSGADTSSCQRAYYQRIQTLCRYPDQSWPCFHGSRLVGGVIQHIFDVSGIAAQACGASAVDFSLGDVYKDVCCFTPDCLEKCYGVIPDLDNDLFIRANNLPHQASSDVSRFYEQKRNAADAPPPSVARISLLESLGVERAGDLAPAVAPIQIENAALRAELEAELFVRLLQAAHNSQLPRQQPQTSRVGLK